MHRLREIFRDLRDHGPEHMRHMGKHRRGRGFGHFFGSDMGDAGFDRSGFRTGRKLAADDLQLLLLTLIAEKPSHGYDLIKVLEERSGGYYVPSPGMIYPALTYLEEAGHATVEPEGTKKLYRISEDGRRHLDHNRIAADALVSQLERIGRRMWRRPPRLRRRRRRGRRRRRQQRAAAGTARAAAGAARKKARPRRRKAGASPISCAARPPTFSASNSSRTPAAGQAPGAGPCYHRTSLSPSPLLSKASERRWVRMGVTATSLRRPSIPLTTRARSGPGRCRPH